MDTTIPEPLPAILSGELSFPSDYIPDDMRVCAENLATGATLCNAQIRDSGQLRVYSLSVPAGRYHVYARTSDIPDFRAYYSEAVTCGLTVECRSHQPIAVDVAAGQRRDAINPHDWYVSQ